MRRAVVGLCLLLTLAIGAREIARVDGMVDEMRMHVRASAPEFSLTFALPGDSVITLAVRNLAQGDGTYPWVSRVALSDDVYADVNHGCSEFSLCVTADEFGTRIAAGDGSRIFDGKINLSDVNTLSFSVSDNAILVRPVDFRVVCKPEPAVSAFADIDGLLTHLAASTDSIEGYWTWVDCDTKTPVVTAGGRYTLATVANDSGGYDIVYVDGARVGKWQSLQIKGTMSPTPFVNQFDVKWLDSAGRDAGEGIYATISGDGIMTLTFAPLQSTMRLIRRPVGRS